MKYIKQFVISAKPSYLIVRQHILKKNNNYSSALA